MKINFLLSIVILLSSVKYTFGEQPIPEEKGIYAVITTTKGEITVKLFDDKTPITVNNFIGLAEGTKKWINPITGQNVKKPFYNGLIFHRVIKDFMIQGGCPLGNGRGNPGYKFEDEYYREGKLIHTVDYGTICMANAGPNTNGSQFFIVTKKDGCPWLNGKHTVFGKVISGMETTHTIENVKTINDKPIEDIIIKNITIYRN